MNVAKELSLTIHIKRYNIIGKTILDGGRQLEPISIKSSIGLFMLCIIGYFLRL